MPRKIFSKNINLKFLHRAFLTQALFFACLSPLGIHAMENQGASQNDETEETLRAQQMRSFLESQRGDSGAGASAGSHTFSESYQTHQTFHVDPADELRRTFRDSHVRTSLLEIQRFDLFEGAETGSFMNSFRGANLLGNLGSFQGLLEETPIYSMAGGRPPSPDIMKEIQRYRLAEDAITNILTSGNFERGNIQSFLENIRSYRRSHYSEYFPLQRRAAQPLQRRAAQNVQPQARRGMTAEDAQNLENVMNSVRISKTNSSMEIVYGLVGGKEINEKMCLLGIHLFLKHLQKEEARYSSFKRANGMNEVDNAFFTLERRGHPGDNDSILLEDAMTYSNLEDGTPVTMKSLLAKTWWLINRQFKDEQQDVLKESLVRALGQCIEDDGHRVCNVGKSQRIVTVLQGYIDGIETDDIHIAPEPDVFLSAFFSSKQAEIMVAMEETPKKKRIYARKLFREIKTTAEEVYKDSPEKMKEVLGNTMDFLRLSFEIQDADLEEYEFSSNLSSSIERWSMERLRRFEQGGVLELRRDWSEIFLERDFVKGNIQSFLASQSSLNIYSSYLFLDTQTSLSSLISSLYLFEGDLSAEAQEEARKSARLTQVRTSIETLYSFLQGQEIDEGLCLQEFCLFLEHLQTKNRGFFKRTNGMNEIDNAFSMLEESRHPEGHDSLLLGRKMDLILEGGEPVTLKSLLAKTWWLIHRQVDKTRHDKFKGRLVRALGFCIEDDEKRVNDIEQFEKITSVLQSDIERIRTEGINIMPNPDSFLSAFFSPKRQEMTSVMERPQEERSVYGHQLFEAIKVAAEDIYDDAPDKKREIDKKASDFLKVSLGL